MSLIPYKCKLETSDESPKEYYTKELFLTLQQLQLKNFYDTVEEQRAISENQSIPFSNRHGADIPGRVSTACPSLEIAADSSFCSLVYSHY